MDIYRVIRESKEGNLFDTEELNRLFSFGNENILLRIVARNDEDSNLNKFATIVLKNRDNFWTAKKEETLEDFCKDLESEIKTKINKNRKNAKKELFREIDKIANDLDQSITVSGDANAVVFRLFLNEYNSKYSFTWKAFKKIKKEYEKNHPLQGEDIFTLKSLLEKDPKIMEHTSINIRNYKPEEGKGSKLEKGKIVDSTVFCKTLSTLSKETIDKIKEKIG